MKLSFLITDKELDVAFTETVRFLRASTVRRELVMFFQTMGVWIFFGISATALLQSTRLASGGLRLGSIAGVVSMAIFAGGVVLLSHLEKRRRYRLARSLHEEVPYRVEFELGDSEFSVRSQAGINTVPFSQVARVATRNGVICIITKLANAFPIPQSAFSSEASERDFVQKIGLNGAI